MNNVLAAIQAVTETLKMKPGVDPGLGRSLGLIEKACTRGRDLVRGLTHFARKGLREPELLDLNGLAREELDLLGRTTLQKVVLVAELEEALPAVLGERGTLAGALMNLCVNAIAAMPEGGTLTLGTRRLPDLQVELTVTDTGAGMDPAVLARAMEPFFTTRPVGQGTGLGLAMAYATAKNHGGGLGIRSEPGRGTSVAMRLPAVTGASRTQAPPAAAPLQAAPRRILLVDDDP